MIAKREKNDGKERRGSQCDHCNRGHIDKVDQSDYTLLVGQSAARKKTISYSKHKILILVANVFSRKGNVSQDNVFLFETLLITPRRRLCLTQAPLIEVALLYRLLVSTTTLLFSY